LAYIQKGIAMEAQTPKTEPKKEAPEWPKILDACLKWDSDKCPDVEKNEWETEFLDSVDKRRKRFGDSYPISEKQEIKLNEIHSKLFP
jgi:hypothetical protein